jgi:DNA-binding NarL/FixJ family response regulator
MGKELGVNKDEMEKAYEEAKEARGGCHKLTPREVEIIRLLGEGLNHSEVAKRLKLKTRTISVHNYKAYRKIKAKNVMEAVKHVNQYYGV